MAGFGLQFLDGVGDAYNQPVFSTPDYENSGMERFYDASQSYNYGENGRSPQQPQVCECDRCEHSDDSTGNLLKMALIFGLGMVAGQAVKKLFKD